MSSPRLKSSFVIIVLAPALILSSFLAVFLIPAITLEMALHNPDWSWKVHSPPLNYEYIDEDFILFNRPFINVSEYPLNERDHVRRFIRDRGWRRFNLRENETAIWRDCTIYTHYSAELDRFGYALKDVEVREGWSLMNVVLEMADAIVLTGTANLTLINVRFSDFVTIRLHDQASLTMINCTNIGYVWHIITDLYWWPSGSPGEGQYRGPTGVVEVEDNATVWIEGTTLGRLVGTQYTIEGSRPGYCADATIIDSCIHEVRIRGQTPVRIIDSEVYELYADEGDVEQIGTTNVTYSSPFFQHGVGPAIAYRVRACLAKHTYQRGEPVNVTIHLENLGREAFTLYFDGRDGIYFELYWYNESSGYADLFVDRYDPDNSAFPPTTTISPGAKREWTLTWMQDPKILPDHYALVCRFYSETLQKAEYYAGSHDFIVTNEPYHGG